MLERLRIRQLQLLVEIAEQASLINAARALNMTQPAATKALKQLEDLFGAALVVRGRRGSQLTRVGEGLYEHAKTILATVRAADLQIRDQLEGIVGKIRVGVLPVALPVLMPGSLERLQKTYPGIVVRATSGDSSFLLEMLRTEKIDFLVGRIWLADDPDIVSTALYSSSFSLVARNGHPIFDDLAPSLSSATRFDWVMPPSGSHGRAAVDTALAKARLPAPRFSMETTSYVLTRELLRKSDMIAPVDRSALGTDLEDGLLRIINIDFETIMPPIGIMSLRGRSWSPAEQRFLQCLTETGRNLI
ncbi:MAG: LysR substrate-binding domain-containing protein [Qingshengfaniella sp.]